MNRQRAERRTILKTRIINIVSALLAVAMLTLTSFADMETPFVPSTPGKTDTPSTPSKDVVWGDVNGDREIDAKDIVLLKKYIANFDYTTNSSKIEVELGADVNGDGEINARDVVLLKKYIANYDVETGKSSITLGSTK